MTEVGGTLEQFTYLGLDMVVERAHEPLVIDHRQTYLDLAGNPTSDSGDPYRGLDRFGRVAEQRWQTLGVDTDRFGYGHDPNSNRLYRENLLVADLSHVSRTYSELYHDGTGYDPSTS